MKSTNRVARIAATLLCLAVFVSASFAKTYPLNQPSGLAVATNGDLYVANEGGNEVLVYSANYSQIAGKTITQGINSPTAVAFDGQGNLWVGTETGGLHILRDQPFRTIGARNIFLNTRLPANRSIRLFLRATLSLSIRLSQSTAWATFGLSGSTRERIASLLRTLLPPTPPD